MAKNKVRTEARSAMSLTLYPKRSKMPKDSSANVEKIASTGANEEGKNELVSAVYCTNFCHPDEWAPQRPDLLATADKNPAAKAILTKKTAMSCFVFIPIILFSMTGTKFSEKQGLKNRQFRKKHRRFITN